MNKSNIADLSVDHSSSSLLSFPLRTFISLASIQNIKETESVEEVLHGIAMSTYLRLWWESHKAITGIFTYEDSLIALKSA